MGASNCPETPRQKMIQMMYLVYTAMLALNVSAAVVASFVTVGDAMAKSNENIELKLQDSYANFAEANKNNPAKTQEWYDKALQVQKLTNGLKLYIDSLEGDFLCEVQSVAEIHRINPETGKYEKSRDIKLIAEDGTTHLIDSALVALREGGLSVIKKKDDNHAGGKYFFGVTDNASGKCVELKQRIIDYKTALRRILGEDSSALQIALDTEKGGYNEEAKKVENWEEINFAEQIQIAYFVTLSRMKAEAMNAEFDAVNILYKKVTQGNFSFDQIAVISRPKATYIVQGGKYETDINVAAYDSKATFTAEIGGRQLTSTDSGSVHYVADCSTTGQKTITGTVYVKTEEGTKSYPFKDSYYVAEPIAVASLTNMQVVYAGIENPISIGVPGTDSRNITPVVVEGNAKITPNPQGKAGDYLIMAQATSRKLVIRIDVKDGKGTRAMGTHTYKVKPIPEPTLNLGNYKKNAKVLKTEFESLTLRPVLEGFDFTLPKGSMKISEFEFQILGAGKAATHGTGNRLSPDMVSQVKRAPKGAKVLIETDVKTPDGVTHHITNTFKVG